jgi:DivIVA domain-containing protein
VPDVRFPTVLRGYDPEQVHELIRLANRALASPDPAERAAVERQLRQPQLHVRLRGYDRSQVEQRLAALADQLSGR